MIKGAIFDFDGTLMDTEINAYYYIKQLFEDKGMSLTQQDYANNFAGHTLEGNLNHLNTNFGFDLTIEEYGGGYEVFEKEFVKTHKPQLKPGIKELLDYLKNNNVKLAIATSSARIRMMNYLNNTDIRDYFDCFITSEDYSKSKPDPEVFNVAVRKLELDKDDCIVFEDAEHGIEAAFNAGIRVICIPDIKMPDESYIKICYKLLKRADEAIEYIKN